MGLGVGDGRISQLIVKLIMKQENFLLSNKLRAGITEICGETSNLLGLMGHIGPLYDVQLHPIYPREIRLNCRSF